MYKDYIIVKHAQPEKFGQRYYENLTFLPKYDREKQLVTNILPGDGLIEKGPLSHSEAEMVDKRPHIKSVEEDVEDHMLPLAGAVETMDEQQALDSDGMDRDARAMHQLEKARAQYFNGGGVRVAVGDTGLRGTTESAVFGGRIAAVRSFITGETIEDGNGHGDFCCVAACPPGAKLIVGKVLSNAGSGARSGIIQFIGWAVENGADIISLSLGGSGFSQAYEDAIAAARAKGVLCFCAAGNEGRENGPVGAPANSPSAIPCAASDHRTGRVADFSCKGPEMSHGFAGAGVKVMYDPPGAPTGRAYSGTSMATPVIANSFATILAQAASPSEALEAMIKGCWNFSGEPATAEGNGIPQVLDSIQNNLPKPAPPPPEPAPEPPKKKYEKYGYLDLRGFYRAGKGDTVSRWGEIDQDGQITVRSWDDPGEDA